MKTSVELFELIKSLTKSEKRYFKLSASLQKGDKNYLKLFNSIAEQKEYNEDTIRKEFKHEKFIRHLPYEKHNLYKLILKSLESYHANTDVDSELKSYLHRIKILYDKALYEQCEKMLLKAKCLAEQHEKYNALLEILVWEGIIASLNADSGNFEQRKNAIYSEKCAVIKKIENTDEYKNLADKIYSLSKMSVPLRSDDQLQKYKKIMNHPLLQGESKAITKESKKAFYYTHALFYRKTGDIEKSYNYRKKIVELLESSPVRQDGRTPSSSGEQLQEHPEVYLNSLRNLLILCSKMSKHGEFFVILKKMRNIPELLGKSARKKEDFKAQIFEASYNYEMDMYIATCQFQKCVSLMCEIEKGMEEFKGKIGKDSEITFYYNCAYLFFIQGEYHKALSWNNKIINDAVADIRHDIYCDARILNLLIHYELGNETLLENVVKSTYRYLYKKERLYKTETAILNFIRKELPKVFTDKERLTAFKKLKTELEEITKDEFEKNVLNDIDYVSWLESKISNKPFAQVLRGKTPHKQ